MKNVTFSVYLEAIQFQRRPSIDISCRKSRNIWKTWTKKVWTLTDSLLDWVLNNKLFFSDWKYSWFNAILKYKYHCSCKGNHFNKIKPQKLYSILFLLMNFKHDYWFENQKKIKYCCQVDIKTKNGNKAKQEIETWSKMALIKDVFC